MKRWMRLTAIGMVVMGTGVFVASAQEATEEKVTIDQVPAAVKATITAEGGKVEDIAREGAGDKTVYEADVIKDGKEIELRVGPDGKLISRKIEGDATEQKGQHGDKEGEESEAQSEARACQEGAEVLAKAKVTMIEALKKAAKAGKGAKPFKADLEMDEGKLIFDIELLDGEKGPEMEIDGITGKVLKIESVEEQEKEDAAEAEEENKKEEERENKAKAAAAKVLPLAKVSLVEAVETAIAQAKGAKCYKVEFKPENGQPRYEAQIVANGKCLEVVVDGITRKVLETEEKGTVSQGGWRDSFPVNKANLVPTGKNPYFSLEPGHKATYKENQTTLTITVLNETKVVDGVTTRIIEEREEKNGKPLEISRNYFAIDKKTNDVYYFGEDVDEYKGDKVSHGGAWLSGVKGARFGLMMPGKLKVGDKFYQEMAPKQAMDRAEIVSLDQEMKTPAGTFKCVYMKESSPLEMGTSKKWYATGVGLVKDDGFVLVAVEEPKK
jgi:uncharacterized membrane protein YkoI